MADKKLIFSNHAVKQMFQKSISVDDVKFVLLNGILVNEYPDDKPLPSMLIFANCNGRSLHIVCSENQLENEIVIITAYEASTEIWENDFVTRKR